MAKVRRLLVIGPEYKGAQSDDAAESAYALFTELSKEEELEVFYLGIRPVKSRRAEIRLLTAKQYILETPEPDPFWLENMDSADEQAVMEAFFELFSPDSVNIHIGSGFSYEIIEIVRHALPQAKIGVSLYTLEPFCLASGGFLLPNGQVCNPSERRFCAACSGQRSNTDGWLRRKRLEHYLKLADILITPTGHMQCLLLDAGFPADRLHFMESCFLSGERAVSSLSPPSGVPVNFGYIGRIDASSGFLTILRAMCSIPAAHKMDVRLVIYAYGFGTQGKPFVDEVIRLRDQLFKEGRLVWYPLRVDTSTDEYMEKIDWMLVPASGAAQPLTILQKAAMYKKPVLGTAAGGIAERVLHDSDGVLVERDNVARWREAFCKLGGNANVWSKMRENIAARTPDSIASDYLEAFKQPSDTSALQL